MEVHKKADGMKYLFVYDGKVWWLKLTNPEQLIDYHKQTSSRYEGAIKLYMEMRQEGKEFHDFMGSLPFEERIRLMDSRDYKYLQCALIKAQKTGGNIFDGFRGLTVETGATELGTIREYGAVFINPAGGHTHGVETMQFCYRKQPIFPCFKYEEIRVKRFEGGHHWYAYIGDVQVRDGDNKIKWDTEEEARRAAEALAAE